MKHAFFPLALCLALAAPAHAQEPEEGLGLVERGLRQLFDGFIQDLEPTLNDLTQSMRELEPMARQLAELIGDVRHYEAPERLENGDIIIRRKADAPPPPPLPETQTDQPPQGQIDL
ncbi:AAA+ family ATPase [Pseudorhodobacter turbinis]|uniref:AAA+ family ATPase n=1 Tax=Pseudorhodobacter turbinis TaxID=2500533 RepID=A0A4V1E0F6_9RHOB|nr:AAA+ family ATPase [Pseudorhodobacter turbinis]QCO54464.1 AAA+ family ATPase [Pseudorhodobacter turbinis]